MFTLLMRRKFQIFKLIVFVLLYALVSKSNNKMYSHSVHAFTRPLDRNAKTLFYYNKAPNAKGDFHYEFQTTNGITIKAAGNENGHSGAVQYVSLEGIPITLTYVADADGYHPIGDYIPEVPKHVLKTAEYIRTHPAVNEKASRHL